MSNSAVCPVIGALDCLYGRLHAESRAGIGSNQGPTGSSADRQSTNRWVESAYFNLHTD